MEPIRVLVVDDSPDLRFLVRRALAERGEFEVIGEAGDGAAAVQRATELQPDLILLDIDMPRMGGLEALPRLRAAAPNARVVMLTSYEREQMERVALANGAVGYLQKGLVARALIDQLLVMTGVLEAVDTAVSEARTRIAGEPANARTARRFVDETLRGWQFGDELDVVMLLVSELVTNAMVHARSDVEVTVRLLSDAVRIDVIDGSDAVPAAREVGSEAESGRGLALVGELARRWGVDRLRQGKTVWFEVERPDTVLGDLVIT